MILQPTRAVAIAGLCLLQTAIPQGGCGDQEIKRAFHLQIAGQSNGLEGAAVGMVRHLENRILKEFQ
jgi:hypothetical protein